MSSVAEPRFGFGLCLCLCWCWCLYSYFEEWVDSLGLVRVEDLWGFFDLMLPDYPGLYPYQRCRNVVILF